MKDKSTPNQMRILLKRMRENNYEPVTESERIPKKDLTMRDMLKITRGKLNEQDEPALKKNLITAFDQKNEEEKFRNFFNDLNVNIDFIPLEVYNNLVFWGGTIDGIVQFIYKVTREEKTSGVEFNYLQDFPPDNPDNDAIIKKVESYYDSFYKYWRNNILQK